MNFDFRSVIQMPLLLTVALYEFLNQGLILIFMKRIEHENRFVTNIILDVKQELAIREFCAWTQNINFY